MNSKEFSEVLELLNESGGKYIVVENGKPSYVLMDIKEYKNMSSNYRDLSVEDMSKEELIEKINEDIAVWRANQEEDDEIDDHFLSADSDDGEVKSKTEYYYDLDKDF